MSIQRNPPSSAQSAAVYPSAHDTSAAKPDAALLDNLGKPLLLNGKSWFMMRSGSEVAAFKLELNQLVALSRGFIRQHAAPGSGMESALKGLEAFERSKVNCISSSRAQATFGINRQNLARFVKLLHDDSYPLNVRCAAAVELFGSLGTCPEGESLRIEEQTAKLYHFGKGLSTRYTETNEQLIDQALIQLVGQEYSWQPNYNELEIHHVNALKNLHCGEWGVKYREDRYSSSMVQDQCGDMAKALIKATVTPNKVSSLLTDQIRDVVLSNLGVPDSFEPLGAQQESCPTYTYQKSTIEQLDAALRVEFGDSINLNDLLEFSEDYTKVSLKTHGDIQRIVLEKMQREGVLRQDAPVSKLMQEHTPTVADALRQITQHFEQAGTSTPARAHAFAFAAAGHGAHTGLGGTAFSPGDIDSRRKKKEEEEQRLSVSVQAGPSAGEAAVALGRELQNQAPAPAPKWSTPENKNPGE